MQKYIYATVNQHCISDVTDAKILAELLGHQKFDEKVIFSTNFYGIYAGLLRLSQ